MFSELESWLTRHYQTPSLFYVHFLSYCLLLKCLDPTLGYTCRSKPVRQQSSLSFAYDLPTSLWTFNRYQLLSLPCLFLSLSLSPLLWCCGWGLQAPKPRDVLQVRSDHILVRAIQMQRPCCIVAVISKNTPPRPCVGFLPCLWTRPNPFTTDF